MTGAHGGRSGDDTIEVQRVALRHGHRFPAPGRATHVIGVRGRPAIVSLDDLFGQDGQAADGHEFEIERGLLVAHKAPVEASAGTLMARVAAGHREAARQGGLVSGSLVADRFTDRAVQSATALLQIIADPIVGQRDRKANAVGLPVRSSAPVDDSVHAAMRRQHGTGLASTSCRWSGSDHRRARNLNL